MALVEFLQCLPALDAGKILLYVHVLGGKIQGVYGKILQNDRRVPVSVFRVSPLQSLKRELLEGFLELVSNFIEPSKKLFKNTKSSAHNPHIKIVPKKMYLETQSR
jgi:hypothetical protein